MTKKDYVIVAHVDTATLICLVTRILKLTNMIAAFAMEAAAINVNDWYFLTFFNI